MGQTTDKGGGHRCQEILRRYHVQYMLFTEGSVWELPRRRDAQNMSAGIVVLRDAAGAGAVWDTRENWVKTQEGQ